MSEFYLKKPKNFHVKVEVSTVFMECEKKLLLLQRSSHKEISPDTWGVPGGKLEKKETPLQGLSREIQEELQLCPSPEELRHIKSLYVRHPRVEYRLHLFQWLLDSIPTIIISPEEHQAFIWQPVNKFGDLPLLEGQLEAFHFIYKPDQNSKI
ncbi:MAG: NUDIX domain-containing protein [Chlamydiia bacterium]|jgi:8-oxo-dGTP pyrophosphatase MutT (NUDIX family)|nr:NUDIX domain-containing protein [Chlamydiia bacterium]